MNDVIKLGLTAVIGFLGGYALDRIRLRRKPALSWRFLPTGRFPKKGIRMFNILLKNVGSVAAKRVRIIVRLPGSAKVAEYDVRASNQAIHLTPQLAEDFNAIHTNIDIFPVGAEIVVGFIATEYSEDEISVEVLDEEGNEGSKFRETKESIFKLIERSGSVATILLTLLAITLVAYAGYLAKNQRALVMEQETKVAIGDLYYRSGKYPEARNEYLSAAMITGGDISAQLLAKVAQSLYRDKRIVDFEKCVATLRSRIGSDMLDILLTDDSYADLRIAILAQSTGSSNSREPNADRGPSK
jgi:hypothetical protein